MTRASVTNRNNRIHRIPQPELPDDCLKQIFDKLNKKEDRDSFGLTCHNFLDIQNSCRKHLDFNSNYSKNDRADHHDSSIRVSNRFHHLQLSTSNDSPLISLLNRFTHLESLSLSNNSDKLLDSSLKKLRKYQFRLHSIDLSGCSYLSDKGLTSVASGCRMLSVIHLHDCKLITDKGLNFVAKFCKTLKQVDLSGCSNITDTGIGHLTQNCRELRALSISGCNKIHGVGFRGCSRSLVSLDAKDCHLYGVAAIFSGGGLEYLNISCMVLTGAIGCGANGANIKILSIRASYVDNYAIVNIAKGCPMLEEWNLSNCVQIYNIAWKSIGFYCQNLKTIHLNIQCFSSDPETTASLTALSCCRRLSVLYMCMWWGPWAYASISPEILNVMREDVKIIECKGVSKNTISWDNWDFAT